MFKKLRVLWYKSWRVLAVVAISIALAAISISVTVWIFFANTPPSVSFDLSEFKGKALTRAQVAGNPLIVNDALFEDALKWGSDAMFVYNYKGITIIKPHPSICGTFLAASYPDNSNADVFSDSSGSSFTWCKTTVNGNMVEARWMFDKVAFGFMLILFLGLSAITAYFIGESILSYKKY